MSEQSNMEWSDTGVTKFAIGVPSENDLKRLKDQGYTHMSNGETKAKDGTKPEKYQIWIK